MWQDRRSAGICQSLREGGHEPAITAQTGLRLDPYFTATKATWIAQNEPHTWASVESGRTAVGTVDSYLLARMTRGLEHITDATNASRTLLYDLLSGSWSDELCSMFSVPTDSLPAIVSSYGYLASTEPSVFCGLDVPICSIAGDQQAALAGLHQPPGQRSQQFPIHLGEVVALARGVAGPAQQGPALGERQDELVLFEGGHRWIDIKRKERGQPPLIDVAFLLLIYFIVTTTLQKSEADLEMALPGVDKVESEAVQIDQMMIRIDSDGGIFVNDEIVDPPGNGFTVPGVKIGRAHV